MSKAMTKEEKKELTVIITEMLESAVSDEYANQILTSENEQTGKTLMDDIIQNVLDTSGWEESRSYNDSDVRYAIGRELIYRLNK